MRLVTYDAGAGPRVGALAGADTVVDTAALSPLNEVMPCPVPSSGNRLRPESSSRIVASE